MVGILQWRERGSAKEYNQEGSITFTETLQLILMTYHSVRTFGILLHTQKKRR